MGLATKFLDHVIGNLAAGAVSSLMEADNKQAEARKAEADAKMKAYELQRKQLEEEARRRKAAEETARLKADTEAKKTEMQSRLYDDNYFTTLQAGLALTWYIAGVDGRISEQEATAISSKIQNIRSTVTIPAKYRDSILSSESYRNMSFEEVKVYLDRADKNSLVSLALRAEYIAKFDGMTDAERAAIDGVKLYVEQKTGYHFKDLHTMPISVSLICPTCGGRLVPDESLKKATCDYCGFTKIVEIKNI